ncbi:MAG: OmpA family protein [Ignavibacteriae bacterium]|nr:OmpA family protein [Ignavibacteriota bacterium]
MKTITRSTLIFGIIFFASCFCLQSQEVNQISSKYDFMPGEKVIFYDDFATEAVGDFPSQWNTNSSGEVVTVSNYTEHWFQMTKSGYFIPETKGDFSENFTIEFDMIPRNIDGNENMNGVDLLIVSGTVSNPNEGGAVPGKAGVRINPNYETISWTNWSDTDEGYKDNGSANQVIKSTEKIHFAFWVQKQRFRMYVGQNKVFDLPRGMIANYKYNIFRFQTNDDATPLITNFRIAAGLPDLRNKILKEGKLISYGFQFDVNFDKVKLESYSTLKEIAEVMKENPNLKIKIVGHTDSDGDNALNLDLSKRRAVSVKKELVEGFSIDSGRIETDGKGETEPLVPNESALNKAKNRRVEFIKL